MIQTPPDDLKDLARRYPPLKTNKVLRAIGNLNKMATYYDSRSDQLSARNIGSISKIFKQYAITLMYLCSIIKMHRQLTDELARIVGETRDGVDAERKDRVGGG